jgi:hypothetical protein
VDDGQNDLAKAVTCCDTRVLVATFCLIHATWHDGSCWEALADRLRLLGHDTIAPDLPYDDPTATYEERARPAITALQSVNDPVVGRRRYAPWVLTTLPTGWASP